MERDPNPRALQGEGAGIAEVAIGESAEDNVGLAPTVEILRGTPLVPPPRIRANIETWRVAPPSGPSFRGIGNQAPGQDFSALAELLANTKKKSGMTSRATHLCFDV